MLLQIVLHLLQLLIGCRVLVLLVRLLLADEFDIAGGCVAGLLFGLDGAGLIGQGLVEGAYLLQLGRGIGQCLSALGTMLFGLAEYFRLLQSGEFQRRERLLFRSQCGAILLQLFAGGAERGVTAIQRGGIHREAEPGLLRLERLGGCAELGGLFLECSQLLFQPVDTGQPADGLLGMGVLFAEHRLFLPSGFQGLLDLLFLLLVKQRDAGGFRLQQVQLLFLGALAFVYADGDLAVDFGAGYLLQNRCALIRCCLQKGGKATLGQQHGAGEAVKVHAGGVFHLFGHPADQRFNHLAGIGIGDFLLRCLQFAFRFLPRAALAPVATVAAGGGFKGHLGKALPGLPGHDFIAALADPVQSGGATVERQADGIQDGGLARAGGPGDGEDAVGCVSRISQVYLPLTHQRVEVLEADLQYFHGWLPYSAWASSS